MAFNPARSWALTYNQMWNICMKDPINRSSQLGNRFYTGTGQATGGNNNNNNKNSGRKGKRKSDYCWNWNKGIPCKFGKNCRFIERCSFCDGGNHGLYNCHKAAAANSNKEVESVSMTPLRQNALQTGDTTQK